MTATQAQTIFSHGRSVEESERVHDALVSAPDWRVFSFRGVLIDQSKKRVFLQLGCPGCDSTVSKLTDLATAMDAVTNMSLVCHRSMEQLTTAVSELGSSTAGDCVPTHVAMTTDVVKKIELGEVVEVTTPGEAIKCCCGRTNEDGVFHPCDADGDYCEPTAADGWAELLRCSHCRRFFNQRTGLVFGFGYAGPFSEDELLTRLHDRAFRMTIKARQE